MNCAKASEESKSESRSARFMMCNPVFEGSLLNHKVLPRQGLTLAQRQDIDSRR